jgi:hypothetical protein
MDSRSAHTHASSENSATLARIDAQDVMYVEPLREFLQTAGCRVIVNQESRESLTYWICVGDSEYVKTFLEGKKPYADRRLCIVYDGDISEQLATRYSTKVVLVDPVALDAHATRDIFHFFFTGRAQILRTRKGLRTPRVVSVIPKQQSREEVARVDYHAQDETRVSSMMQQIFAQSQVAPKKQRPNRSPIFILRQVLMGIGISIGVSIGVYIVTFIVSVACIYGASVALANGNGDWAKRFIEPGRRQAQSAQALLQISTPVLHMVGMEGFAQDQELLLGLLLDAAKTETAVLRLLDAGKSVVVGLLGTETVSTQSKGLADVLSLTADVSLVAQHMALVQAQLDSLLLSRRFPFSIARVQQAGHKALAKIADIRHSIDYVQKLLTLYPEIGGFRKKQTYLVLLQNSMELRPTGGFIGSLALVSFADGKMTALDIQDVYAADGQLKGHVDPPLPIRNILGQEHWYLRDSNWNPDFSVSGPMAAWFYEKEMGTHVDGVIAISLPFVTKLLELTGPIELTDFNERISASNFFVKSLLYTQTDFFPGSTQKKDFLGSLTNALLTRLTTDRNLSAVKLLQATSSSLDGRDIQFYFADTNVQTVIAQWQWAGGATFAPCQPVSQSIPCISDGVGIVQANLGVNKVNYFIKQEAIARVIFDEAGNVTQEVTATIRNDSSREVHDGGGDYRSYTRFLYPAGTEFISATVDGQKLPLYDAKSKNATASAVTVEESGGVVSIGLPLVVPAHGQGQVQVVTLRRNIFTFKPSASYVYRVRKQAGVGTFPWQTIIEYPNSWGVQSDSQLAKPGVLEYNTDLTRDGVNNILFTQSL